MNPVDKQTNKKRVMHNPYLSLCDGSIYLNKVILRSILRVRFLLANEIDLNGLIYYPKDRWKRKLKEKTSESWRPIWIKGREDILILTKKSITFFVHDKVGQIWTTTLLKCFTAVIFILRLSRLIKLMVLFIQIRSFSGQF